MVMVLPLRVPVRGRRPTPRRWLWLALVACVIAATVTCVLRPSAGSVTDPVSISASGWYVSLDLHADADTKRRAGFLSRKFRIPLIAEPNANGVEIRRFQ